MKRRPRPRLLPMPYPSRASSAELFADISSNNGSFDALQYRSAGHRLIAIKATQGDNYVNPDWQGWVAHAHAQRLAVAHYHFAGLTDPRTEAGRFWETVRPHFHNQWDRLVLDIETGNQASWRPWIQAFDQELHRLSGIHPIGYTFASALGNGLPLEWWWVAAWGSGRPGVPGGKLWAWQYAQNPPRVDPSGGPSAAAGIGACDMSVISPGPLSRILRAVKDHK